jgi:hypothetical protein
VTHLRKMMLEELQRRNFAKTTVQYYLQAVEEFAAYFGKPPDQLNQDRLAADLQASQTTLGVSGLSARQLWMVPEGVPFSEDVPSCRKVVADPSVSVSNWL